MPLIEENQKHLTAAEGYVELGMFLNANEELEEIVPEVRHVPEVPGRSSEYLHWLGEVGTHADCGENVGAV